MQKDKFGFQRGQCTAGTCTCEDSVIMKATHDCKTCFHTPRHHQYYNKDYKNEQQQQLEQSSRSSLLSNNHQPQDRPTSMSTSTKRQQAPNSFCFVEHYLFVPLYKNLSDCANFKFQLLNLRTCFYLCSLTAVLEGKWAMR